MKYVFLGAPGVGKGTQAVRLSEEMSLAHISTGAMLRAAVEQGSELGSRVKDIIDSGKLIPDDLMVEVIKGRIDEKDCKKGYILDGFPRTVAQAEALTAMLSERNESLTGVVVFVASDEDLLARLTHRRSSEGRADDSAEVQQKRLEVYNEQTAPLIDYYREREMLIEVDGRGNIEEVFARLTAIVGA